MRNENREVCESMEELLKDKYQHIYWADLPDNVEMELELIKPFSKSVTKPFASGGYYIVKAICKKENAAAGIVGDEFITIEFPIRMFTRAWKLLSYRSKMNIEADNNVFVIIKKISRQAMKILHIERRVGSDPDAD